MARDTTCCTYAKMAKSFSQGILQSLTYNVTDEAIALEHMTSSGLHFRQNGTFYSDGCPIRDDN